MSDALNDLLNSVVNADEMETDYRTCPEVEANATIKKVSLRSGTSVKMVGPSNSAGLWVSMAILWEVDSEEARKEMKRDDVVVPQDIFLTVKDGAEGTPIIDAANNQTVAALIKLFDLEGEMTLQEIIDSFQGQLAFVRVKQEPYEERMIAKVVDVAEAQ